ncbi:MAG: hypothetical protein HY000_21425 [Planctomycetes bacterium]|nr:hypothetical protein [Planctomycetota bacterium]
MDCESREIGGEPFPKTHTGKDLKTGGAAVAINEAFLREGYLLADEHLGMVAREMVAQGVPLERAARWRVEATNKLKDVIRKKGSGLVEPISQWLRGAEDKPTYEQMFDKRYWQLEIEHVKKGIRRPPTAEEVNKRILTRIPNRTVTKLAFTLKVAGSVWIAMEMTEAGMKVYNASPGSRLRTFALEFGRIGASAAGGVAGNRMGAWAGTKIGLRFGVRFGPWGAEIGGALGTIGGSIAAGVLVDKVIDKFFPIDDTDIVEGLPSVIHQPGATDIPWNPGLA